MSITRLKDAWGNEVTPRTRETFIKGINHRGYCTEAPENTLPAYILSYEKGFRYVECDVAFTSDNVAVLLHDSTIDRTSDGSGTIASMTYAQVSQYDFGSWFSSEFAGTKIPTLAEFLALCRNYGMHPYIEIKSNANYSQEQLKIIVDLVSAYGMKGNVTYISFNLPFLQSIKEIDSTARLGYLVQSVSQSVIDSVKGLRTGYNDAFVDSSSYGSSVIELCKSNGVSLEVWTLNSENTIKNLDSFISGVTSDSVNVENYV